MYRKLNLFVLFFILLTACTNNNPTTLQPGDTPQPSSAIPDVEASSAPTTTLILSPTPQLFPTPVVYGPEEFPTGFNPLTGQRVSDPSQLTYPALLLSISHFPPA